MLMSGRGGDPWHSPFCWAPCSRLARDALTPRDAQTRNARAQVFRSEKDIGKLQKDVDFVNNLMSKKKK